MGIWSISCLLRPCSPFVVSDASEAVMTMLSDSARGTMGVALTMTTGPRFSTVGRSFPKPVCA